MLHTNKTFPPNSLVYTTLLSIGIKISVRWLDTPYLVIFTIYAKKTKAPMQYLLAGYFILYVRAASQPLGKKKSYWTILDK